MKKPDDMPPTLAEAGIDYAQVNTVGKAKGYGRGRGGKGINADLPATRVKRRSGQRGWQQLADVPQEQLEIKLRAERKAGQLLKQMAQASALLNTPQRGPWPRAARARGQHMVFAHIGSR